MSDLTNPIFTNEDKAREHLEAIRWPDGPVCPSCGFGNTVKPLGGKSMGPGWYHCGSCREKFTVRVGAVYERSKIPLHKWLLATHLVCASKKGMSAHQLHRMLGITYKSAWFMLHRIRESMRDDNPGPMGGPGEFVEADETYIGKRDKKRTLKTDGTPFLKSGKAAQRVPVVSLVSGGKSRSFAVSRANTATIREILVTNVDRATELHTDEAPMYVKIGDEFKAHKTVNHSRHEYVRKDGVTTNRVENFFSVFKLGMRGVYQHCREKHLQRYLDEFDFRYNNREITDAERRDVALRGSEGKRLTYRRTADRAYI